MESRPIPPGPPGQGRHWVLRLAVPALSAVLVAAAPAGAGSLTLQEGLEIVTSRGYDVRMARARQSAAEEAQGQTLSRLKPHVAAYAEQTWLQNRPEAIFGTGSSPLSEDHFLRYGVTVRQLLTDFGKTGSEVDVSRAAARAQESLTLQTVRASSLQFVQAYVSLLQAQRSLEVAEQEVRQFEAHVRSARALHEAGEVTLSDVLSSEVALSDAMQRRISARHNREIAASTVNFLTLRPLSEPLQVQDFPSPLEEIPSLDSLLEGALERSPALRALSESITAKEAQMRSSEAGRYPTVFAGGGYSFEENPYRVYEDNWSAVLGVTWDLYTGGALSASRARISRELTALLAERERLREQVLLDLQEAFLQLTAAAERMEMTRKAAAQAEESVRLQEARYAEGEVSATDVTDAVTSLTRARTNHWTALYDRRRAEARLLNAGGMDIAPAYAAPEERTTEASPPAGGAAGDHP